MLYDGSCPLCSREIAWYRRRQSEQGICWQDVSQDNVTLPGQLTRSAAMARFHVCRSGGDMLSGAEAFVELWSRMPGLGWAARLARRLHLIPLMEWGYRRFLPLRGWLVRVLFRKRAAEIRQTP